MLKMKTFSPNLDIISENIIYLLSINSRLSITELSKLLKLQRKIVEHRYKKLFSEGYIKPLLIYNYAELTKATILIKLSKFDEIIINNIAKLGTLVKVKETLGNYDISLLIMAENRNDIYKLMDRINKLLHKSIINLEVLYHDIEDTLGYKSFCHDTSLLNKYTQLKPKQEYSLTDDDKYLLNILKKDPIKKYSNLMKETRWSYNKIKDTIDNLLDNKILRFSVDPNYQKIGVEFHNILIKINLAREHDFEKNILMHPQVHWIKKSKGSWDYVLSVTAKDIQDFIFITRDIRTKNKDIILNFTTLISHIHVMRKL